MSSANYLQNMFGLEGLNAVVIGGTGVLGGAMAEALASAGAYVYIVGRNEQNGLNCLERIKEAGGNGEFYSADATSKADLECLVYQMKEAERECHVLINGAGVNSPTPFLDIQEDEWDRIININLSGVRIACQVIGKYMLECETAGSIINVASLSAITPLSRVFTYSASKAAVLNLTQNIAREWAASGIRVNAISPGFFPAEQNRKVLTEERVSSIMTHTPMDRFGSPEELAGAILLLASPQAGSFMCGHNLVVDGGFSSMTI